MENNGIQDGIEEIRERLYQEEANIRIYADDKDMVEYSTALINRYKVHIARLERMAKALPIEEEIVQSSLKSPRTPEFIKDIWRRVYLFCTFRAKMEPTFTFNPELPQHVKEDAYFAKKNNIMEASLEAPPVESSNWKFKDRYVWPIELEYNGYMIQAEDKEDFRDKCKQVEKALALKLPILFYTVQQFQEKFYPKPVLDEPVEQFENDIENLAQPQMPAPDYNSTTGQFPGIVGEEPERRFASKEELIEYVKDKHRKEFGTGHL